jgi:hypothetical protein
LLYDEDHFFNLEDKIAKQKTWCSCSESPPRKNKKPISKKRAFCCVFFVMERRYAKLGHLLLYFSEPAVKPGVSALPLRLASYLYPTMFHRTHNAPVGGSIEKNLKGKYFPVELSCQMPKKRPEPSSLQYWSEFTDAV